MISKNWGFLTVFAGFCQFFVKHFTKHRNQITAHQRMAGPAYNRPILSSLDFRDPFKVTPTV
ncbi:MAG: hypothetical protein ACYDEV_09690 [Acidiferrobacter sp.]